MIHCDRGIEVEASMAEIGWNLPQVDRIGGRDDLFCLGGHSLTATRLISHSNHKCDIDVPPSVLFEARTVEALSRHVLQQMVDSVSTEAS